MTALFEFLKARVAWFHADRKGGAKGDDAGGEDGEPGPRPMTGVYAQLSPEQRMRAREHEGDVRSGLSDLPTVR